MSAQNWTGQSLNFQYSFPTLGNVEEYLVVVDGGPAVSIQGGFFTIQASSLGSTEDFKIVWAQFASATPAAFNGFGIAGSGSYTISSVTLVSDSANTLQQSNLSFIPSSFLVNWQGLSFVAGETIDIHVNFTPTPSPDVTPLTPQIVEHGQSTVIGTVRPGSAGDTLAVSGTAPGGSLSLGAVVGGVQQIVYTAAATVPASVIESVSYSVSDTTNGTSTAGSAKVQLDAGPAALAATVTIEHATVANLTALVAGLIVPGLAGDTETVVAVSGAAHLDPATHAISYAAPNAGTADSFSYTVQDQHGGTATGTVAVAIRHDDTVVILGGYNNVVSGPLAPTPGNGAAGSAINGGVNGYATIAGTAASETIRASGYGNSIAANGGNDTIYAGLGSATVRVSDANGNNTVAGSLGTTHVTLGDGKDAVNLGGYGNVVALGNGSDTVVAGAGLDSVSLGSGNDSVVLGGTNNVVTATGAGNDTVSGGQGQDQITLGDGQDSVVDLGSNDRIRLGSGNDTVKLGGYGDFVQAGNGNDTVLDSMGQAIISLGDGRDQVVLGGTGNTVVAGSGGVTVSGGNGADGINLGDGTNSVREAGFSNAIKVGNGTNTIVAGDGAAHVIAGNGTNTITAAGFSNLIDTGRGSNTILAGAGAATVHLGGGKDSVALLGFSNLVQTNGGHAVVSGGQANTYVLGAAGGLEVMDFAPSSSDLLDVSGMLAALHVTAATLGNFVHANELAGTTTTVVSLDASGHGGAGVVVATLHGAGATSLAALQAHNEIRLF